MLTFVMNSTISDLCSAKVGILYHMQNCGTSQLQVELKVQCIV